MALKDPRRPARLAVQFHGQGLAVQGGGQVDDVGRGGAGLHQRAVKPAPRVLALQGRLDVAVVLQVVADDERGAMRRRGGGRGCRCPVPKASMATPLRSTIAPARQTGPRPAACG